MNFIIESDKGYSGLKNLGNTCFLNSCIQILSHTHELQRFLLDTPHPEDADAKLLKREYCDIIQLMWSQNCIVTPGRFVFVVHAIARNKNKELFTGFSQNDATEFLQFLMDCFVGTEKIFYGKVVSTICSVVEGVPSIVSKQSEPFFILNIPIPGGGGGAPPTKNDCISKFTEHEILDGENKWYNEKTKQYEDAIKSYDFEEFPPILVITLKRFNNIHKNEILVKFDEILEIKDARYELYGVCNHMGNAFFGHYTAFVKHILGGQWIHYNDHVVEKVPEFSNIVSPHAYCFFYRRMTTQ